MDGANLHDLGGKTGSSRVTESAPQTTDKEYLQFHATVLI